MKKMIFVLAMLLTAATAYTQTSRKPANNNTATSKQERINATTHGNVSNTNHDRISANSRRSENTANTNPGTVQTSTNRSENRVTVHQQPVRTEANEQKPVRNRTNTVSQSNEMQHVTTSDRHREDQHAVNNGNHQTVQRTADRHNNVVVYESPRVYRENHQVVHQYNNPPASREYRSVHHVYRIPYHYEVYWTPVIHNHFIEIYPMVHHWNYYDGYRIEMISAYDALYYRGDVMTVYGEVTEVFYSWSTDEYFLYFGAYYPYQDFTVIVPGYLARRYSHHPEKFFRYQCMAVTGLITSYNGEPEIVVKRDFQINVY